MIKTFIFDKEKYHYTEEVEDISLDAFIKSFVMRMYNGKIEYISKKKLQDYCDNYHISYEKSFSKKDFINQILNSTTLVEKMEFCDMHHIGVTKYNYLASGMSEEDYKKIYRKLVVVGKEIIAGKRFKNLYSVKQYLDYTQHGVLPK